MLFNGIDLSDRFRIKDIRGRGLIQRRVNGIPVPGMPGEYVSSIETPSKFLEIDIRIVNKNLRQAIDDLNGIFATDEPVPIIFPDEPDKTYFGMVETSEETGEKLHLYRHDTTFFIRRSDPNKYGPEKVLTFPADIVTINNKGTAEADPIFELTATKKTTFAMISNGDEEYNLIGRPADVDEEIVDERTTLVTERGETLDTWTSAGTKIDSDNAEVRGTMGTDGTGIVVLNYGTPSTNATWYGPALLKEIPPIQDFEVEMRLRAESKNANQVYRIEFYLFDENMNVLGKMAIWDNSQAKSQYIAEGRVGEFLGTQKNYLISSKNYNYDRKHFHGMLRMRRIGKRFEFYVARTMHGGDETGKHYDELMVPFIDNDNGYQGKLKYVQIHIGTHKKGSPVNLPRINNFKVTELRKTKVDQTPYILYPDDVVTFDHKDDDILINGEPRNDLKNFGGSFFKLAKGENMLIVSPEDSFDVTCRVRDKYL